MKNCKNCGKPIPRKKELETLHIINGEIVRLCNRCFKKVENHD